VLASCIFIRQSFPDKNLTQNSNIEGKKKVIFTSQTQLKKNMQLGQTSMAVDTRKYNTLFNACANIFLQYFLLSFLLFM